MFNFKIILLWKNVLSFGKNSILISIHNDAFTDNWSDAHGYSVYTSPGKTKSDDFAQNLLLKLKICSTL